jgi:hypothetical protein
VDEIARAVLAVEAEREALQLIEYVGSDRVDHALADPRADVSLEDDGGAIGEEHQRGATR